jgi:hypothetical protein
MSIFDEDVVVLAGKLLGSLLLTGTGYVLVVRLVNGSPLATAQNGVVSINVGINTSITLAEAKAEVTSYLPQVMITCHSQGLPCTISHLTDSTNGSSSPSSGPTKTSPPPRQSASMILWG